MDFQFHIDLSFQKSLWLPPPSEPLKTRSSFASSLQTTLRTELGRGIGGIDGLGSSTASTSVPSPSARTREIDSFLEGTVTMERDYIMHGTGLYHA